MIKVVFIKEQFFELNAHFEEMLDPFNIEKQTSRQYLYIKVKYRDKHVLVPLRGKLPSNNQRLCYPIPSTSRPKAGLDIRKLIILNDTTYLEIPHEQRLAKSQLNIITTNYIAIEKAVIKYIDGYIKSVRKRREKMEYDYKFSTLHNFHKELGLLDDVSEEVATTKEYI